jgi:hypothetical protein
MKPLKKKNGPALIVNDEEFGLGIPSSSSLGRVSGLDVNETRHFRRRDDTGRERREWSNPLAIR